MRAPPVAAPAVGSCSPGQAAFAGSGTIAANGSDGQSGANDGAGGGGAGGSVLVDAVTGTLAGLTVTANGGAGGNAWATQPPGGSPGERHGPGGGGGGGVVLASSAPAATSVAAGGLSGTTTTAADTYGATSGADGTSATLTPSAVPGADAGARCTPVLTVTKSTSTPNVVNGSSGTTATYAIRVENEISRATATAVSISDVLPTGFSYASTTTIGLTGGATRDTTVNPTAGATTPSWGTFSIPGGGAVTVTFVANVSASVPAGTVQNPATATYDDLASPGGTATASYDPASSTAEDVTVTVPGTSPPPPPPPPPAPSPSPSPSPPPPPPAKVPVADLAVSIGGPAVAEKGDTVPLVVTVTNRGPDDSPEHDSLDHAPTRSHGLRNDQARGRSRGRDAVWSRER